MVAYIVYTNCFGEVAKVQVSGRNEAEIFEKARKKVEEIQNNPTEKERPRDTPHIEWS